MTTKNLKQLSYTYSKLLNQQKFVPGELDYSAFEEHKTLLKTLASVGNSGVSVFDLYKNNHLFYSPNFGSLLGYNYSFIQEKGSHFWDSKIHPEDFMAIMESSISLLKLYFQFSIDERANYKLINEYRMLNSENTYVRIIEQHQVLEMDKYGNIWLALSIIDLSPDQNIAEGFRSVLHNFRTGNIIPFGDEKRKSEAIKVALSIREIQILKMVKEGLLSKEISANLNISLHTVNTHRQRLLEKLGAGNSMEAVIYASKFGLL